MKIKIMPEYLKILNNDKNEKITKNSKMCVIDGYNLMLSKTVRNIIRNNLTCMNCKRKANYINISENTIDVPKFKVHQISFSIDAVKLETVDDCKNAIVCSNCKDEYIKQHKKPVKRYADYDFYDNQARAEYKNDKLVRSLNISRDNFCGLGTRKVKLRLNKLIKDNNKDAEILRNLLELEDVKNHRP